MPGDIPKISFIPKNPLAREASFMERRRPRSIMGLLAIFASVASIGAYVLFYSFGVSIGKEIEQKTVDINNLHGKFKDSPQVAEAKAFRSRAELAKELLDQHIVVSPIFKFLSDNTLASVQYNSFMFKSGSGSWVLELLGEAPSYTSLAYQQDVLRGKKNDIADFSIKNVSLEPFGSVKFTLSIVFAPGYLSYTKDRSIVAGEDMSQSAPDAPLSTTMPPLLQALTPATTTKATSTRTGPSF